jgi:hypothetical protein
MPKPRKQTWPLPEKEENLLKRYFRLLFKCEHIRLSSPLQERIFLITGIKRNTQQDQGVWKDQHGNTKNWDYILEQAVASGNNVNELISNAKKYKTLTGKKPLV